MMYALLIILTLLTGCATDGSEYDQAFERPEVIESEHLTAINEYCAGEGKDTPSCAPPEPEQ